jgi:hypothetical protein
MRGKAQYINTPFKVRHEGNDLYEKSKKEHRLDRLYGYWEDDSR